MVQQMSMQRRQSRFWNPERPPVIEVDKRYALMTYRTIQQQQSLYLLRLNKKTLGVDWSKIIAPPVQAYTHSESEIIYNAIRKKYAYTGYELDNQISGEVRSVVGITDKNGSFNSAYLADLQGQQQQNIAQLTHIVPMSTGKSVMPDARVFPPSDIEPAEHGVLWGLDESSDLTNINSFGEMIIPAELQQQPQLESEGSIRCASSKSGVSYVMCAPKQQEQSLIKVGINGIIPNIIERIPYPNGFTVPFNANMPNNINRIGNINIDRNGDLILVYFENTEEQTFNINLAKYHVSTGLFIRRQTQIPAFISQQQQPQAFASKISLTIDRFNQIWIAPSNIYPTDIVPLQYLLYRINNPVTWTTSQVSPTEVDEFDLDILFPQSMRQPINANYLLVKGIQGDTGYDTNDTLGNIFVVGSPQRLQQSPVGNKPFVARIRVKNGIVGAGSWYNITSALIDNIAGQTEGQEPHLLEGLDISCEDELGHAKFK